jgi:hypothetical protein
MKNLLIVFLISFIFSIFLSGQSINFDECFLDKTMRVDYCHIADAMTDIFTLDHIYIQGIWAGSRTNLLEDLNIGRYYINITDPASGKLLYSRGFDSYCGEYKTTNDAAKGVKRTFYESALIPCPKKKVLFSILARDRNNQNSVAFSTEIDPDGFGIINEKLIDGVTVFDLVKNGDPHKKVDIAIVAEGYTKADEKKLLMDFKRFSEIFFKHEPFKSYKDKFNIYGVWKPSEEQGCDEPPAGIFRNTSVSTTYNSLGSERYLLTEANKDLRDIAAHAPYDSIMIMVNQTRYGGGGIYNFYCTFVSDNQWSEYVFIHEFGHCFTGLADEYYTSTTAYNDFYPLGVEPAEPNITALLNPATLKWKNDCTKGVAIPTLWEKEDYDRMDAAYQKIRGELNDRIARMKREGAPADQIEKINDESERLSKENAAIMDAYLSRSKFIGVIGAFEGAGYSEKGLYRPMLDCIMFSKGVKPFCKVCESAIIRTISHYTE